MACGVFAPIFFVLHLFFFFFAGFPALLVLLPALFVLVSLGVFVSCCGCVVGFSFSLSDYTQKERAQSVSLASSLVLLWACLYV